MMTAQMPSPFGHVLAGAIVGFVATPRAPDTAPPAATDEMPSPGGWAQHPWFYPALSGLVAALPDIDLLMSQYHRRATHSLTATVLIIIVTMVVTGKVTGRINLRLALVLGLAHATHLVLDWLGADRFRDRGIQLFWPFVPTHYISELDWFPGTERRLFEHPRALAINARAFLTEVATLGPPAWLAWWLTRTRRSRGPISAPGSPRPPSA